MGSNQTMTTAQVLRKASLWKRATAFLFTHDWDVVDATIRAGCPWTRMQCSKCGEQYWYPTLDRSQFAVLYRSRGCTRSALAEQDEKKGESNGK